MKIKSKIKFYDHSINLAQFIFPKGKLDFRIKSILFNILKNNIEKEIQNKELRMDISIIFENSGVITSENLYQYGKIELENNINYYILKINKLKNYIFIQ